MKETTSLSVSTQWTHGALLRRAEKAHPKATLRNRLYEDFGKHREKEGARPQDVRVVGNAQDLASEQKEASEQTETEPRYVESVTREEGGVARQLEPMFWGAILPCLENIIDVQLPIIYPLTGERPMTWLDISMFRLAVYITSNIYFTTIEYNTCGFLYPCLGLQLC